MDSISPRMMRPHDWTIKRTTDRPHDRMTDVIERCSCGAARRRLETWDADKRLIKDVVIFAEYPSDVDGERQGGRCPSTGRLP